MNKSLPEQGTPVSQIVYLLVAVILLTMFVMHVTGRIKIDAVGLALLLFNFAPLDWPDFYAVRSRVHSRFADGQSKVRSDRSLKIEFLEQKVKEQELKLERQRQLLDDLVLYPMAWYI